jgi:hypothetical protein
MTTYEKAAGAIEIELIKHKIPADDASWLARSILSRMQSHRIGVIEFRASEEMFTRFHAHLRFFGQQQGNGYRYWYNRIIAECVEEGEWPVKMATRYVDLASKDVRVTPPKELDSYVTVDVPVPESTKRATNGQLLGAYERLLFYAAEAEITLPEAVVPEYAG